MLELFLSLHLGLFHYHQAILITKVQKDKIEINYDGKDIKVSVNIGYILDVLTVIDNENVSISLMDDGNAILIYDNEKEEAKYLVMTMEF